MISVIATVEGGRKRPTYHFNDFSLISSEQFNIIALRIFLNLINCIHGLEVKPTKRKRKHGLGIKVE